VVWFLVSLSYMDPPTLRTSGMFYDKRVRYPDIYCFSTNSAQIL